VRSSFRHAVRGCGGQYRAWWDACPLYGQHARVVCLVRAPRSCCEQGCAAHCGSVAHAGDVPRSYGVRCARRGSGVCVPCRAWLRRPSAHQVHFARRYARWCRAPPCAVRARTR
jgi:hypothetical protein